MSASSRLDALVDGGRVPDAVLRGTIRGLLRARRRAEGSDPALLAERLWAGPVTVAVDAANVQHY
ncbi:MAG: SAM-dependent methyltransferase, partial [Actinomycetota bacterium]|nr:SAM-dependent methyltransferase [Actinomycetota bacterium]